MGALSIEFKKLKRRKIWLVIAALLVVQAVWALWATNRMNEHELLQGWEYFLYQLPVLNAIVMPVLAAVVASRISDVEHKGQMFKVLETLMPAGKLFDTKFLCGSVYMLITAAAQILLIITAAGLALGFQKPVPFDKLFFYFIFTTAANLTILLFQQILSLLFTNQAVSLAAGLAGGFIGLFTMFFPQGLDKIFIWGYYGALMFVRMDWDKATRITNFYYAAPDWAALITLIFMFLVIYIVGRILFKRREV